MTHADLDLDLEDLAPSPHDDVCLPEPDDADDVPWAHPDPWTAEQAREAYWQRVEELNHG